MVDCKTIYKTDGQPDSELGVESAQTTIVLKRYDIPKHDRRGMWGYEECVICHDSGPTVITTARITMQIDAGVCNFDSEMCASFLAGECDGQKGAACAGSVNVYLVCVNCDALYWNGQLFSDVFTHLLVDAQLDEMFGEPPCCMDPAGIQ